MILIDAVNFMKYVLENSIVILVWLAIFFGATSVYLTEKEQLTATIVPTGPLKILMRILACRTQKKG